MLIKSQKLSRDRKGVVLLAVLVVITLLFLAAYQYSDLMMAEYKAGDNAHRAVQAKAVADSGVHYAAMLLAKPDNIVNLLNGNPYHSDRFANIQVGGEGKPGGRFYILAPNPSDPTTARPGVSDETGKININAMMKRDTTGELLYSMLAKLPIPADNWRDVAASIVDWVDFDSTPREGGAENDYYSAKNPSYRCKNGPLDSIEELLFVKGIDENPWLLYGDDKNRNGIQDDDEIASNGEFFPGLAAFLTVHSRETNLGSDGLALAYVNDDQDLETLYEKLAGAVGENMAKFVILFRQYGPATTGGAQQGFGTSVTSLVAPKTATKASSGNTKQGKLEDYTPSFTRSARKKINSLFDLVDTQVSVTATEKQGNRDVQTTTIYASPLNDAAGRRELLPKLFAKSSTVNQVEIAARINVNTAAREVLLAIPDLTEAEVESILSLRPNPDSAEPVADIYQTLAWLLTDGNLKVATLQKIEQSITTRTQVYRVQVIGFLDSEPQTSARVEAVIDANNGRPRILAWRDLGDWGRGIPKLP